MDRRSKDFWFLQVPGWLLFAYLVYAQAIPAFNYDLGVTMGTQEPASAITGVGVAFWYGFALADLLVYLPILGLGLFGYGRRRRWGTVILAAALGITVYWPVVCLVAVATARGEAGWSLPNEAQYWTVLPLIAAWAVAGLWYVLRQERSG